MSDPAVEAALRATKGKTSHLVGPGRYALRGAREALGPIRAKHRPVAYINRQRCCLTCWDANGKPHLWPCPVAPDAYSSEEPAR